MQIRESHSLLWNCEGLKSNIFTLKPILSKKSPDLCFLSEPQTFQCDAQPILDYIKGEYCFALNSDDLHVPELPLVKNKSVGGTLCLWKKHLDPYVSVIDLKTPSFTPLILKLPNFEISIHIAIYLPTHGKDLEFMSDLADLGICIEELQEAYPTAPLYIRGDGNVNVKNVNRVALLNHFLQKFSLAKVPVPHKTYHHFVGSGLYDSDIDVILNSVSIENQESVTDIMCKLDHPTILSHHDVILSDFSLQSKPEDTNDDIHCEAPKVEIKREKIIWSDEGVKEFKNIVTPQLQRLRENWFIPSSQACMSILLDLSNKALSMAASSTNRTVLVGTKRSPKSTKTPKPVIKADQS